MEKVSRECSSASSSNIEERVQGNEKRSSRCAVDVGSGNLVYLSCTQLHAALAAPMRAHLSRQLGVATQFMFPQ